MPKTTKTQKTPLSVASSNGETVDFQRPSASPGPRPVADKAAYEPPPHVNLEAEQSVIGGLLLDAEQWPEISAIVQKYDFHSVAHQKIFQAIADVVEKGNKAEKPDLVTVADELEKRDELDAVGGIPYLSDISRNTPSVVNLPAYARIVRERATLRKMARQLREITETEDLAAALSGAAAALERAELHQPDADTDEFLAGSQGFDVAPDWLVDELIPSDTLGVVFGPTGSYKSFFVLDLACCIASGNPWAGKDTRQGRVVYIAGEGQNAIGARVRSWELANDAQASEVLRKANPVNFADAAQRHKLIQQCRKMEKQGHPVRLIIIDTLNTCFGDGDEDKTKDMTAFINGSKDVMRQTGASVLVVHHTGHEGTRGRGNSALKSGADYEYSVTKDGDNRYRVKNTKPKDFAPPPPFTVDLAVIDTGAQDSKGRPITSLARRGGISPTGNRGPMNDDLEALIALYHDQGGHLPIKYAEDHFRHAWESQSSSDDKSKKKKASLTKWNRLVERAEKGWFRLENGRLELIPDDDQDS